MNIETRIAIEKQITAKVIADALAAGYSLSVHDGEEITVRRSTDASAIAKGLQTTDEDRLLFHKPGNVSGNNGFVFFVYGNDGYDVICDHSVILTELLKGAEALAATLENRHG